MKKDFVCIVCPNGCRLHVDDAGGELEISGYACPRGEAFARAEFTRPMRMLTTTVKLEGAALRRLPVVSSAEVPRDRLAECLDVVYRTAAKAPVSCGDVIVPDILGLGVDIVASRSVPAQ